MREQPGPAARTLPTHRDPRVAPYNPQYENPRYVAPIPSVDPWARPHYAGYSPRPTQLMPPQSFAREFDFRPRRSKRRGPWIGVGMAVPRAVIERAKVTTVIVPSAHFDRSSPLTGVEVTRQARPR